MVDWTPYLNSVCNAYTKWWTFGTLKDVVEPKRFEFDLMVQTVERDTQQRTKEEQKVEPLRVLEGLRKYASEHVLLVGRPGSGKSTALVRLLVATAQQALQNPHSQISVLVELRTYKIYYKTSVLNLVQASLKRHKLRLNLETIEELLAQGRFLLLMDGINELPDDEARRTIKEFRLDYSDVPMVFTTRDLGVGGDLGIEKKLEMQSLTEAEVEKFVRKCMPGGSQQTLQQLRQRLRELGQTPFVMWMLYFIVQKTGDVPSGAGSAFREFTQLYERRSKDDAPVSEESRRWWSRLLEHLAFEMMQADKPTDFRLTISRREAEDILTKFLDSEKFDKPRDRALRWLEDLVRHHLIQVTSSGQIEFCHQLIQEYYAAEQLLKLLTSSGRTSPPAPLLRGKESKIPVPPFPAREGGLGGLGLSDDELKRNYLNYLKWTEPLALMLELVEDKGQAVRVVRLALKVDWWLGAKLAGAVTLEFQEQTVGLVAGLEIPQLLKIQLLGITQSEKAIPELVQALEDEDSFVRWNAAEALGHIGSETVVSQLIQLLEDEDSFVRMRATDILGHIGSEVIRPQIVKLRKDKNNFVRNSAADALKRLDEKALNPQLIQLQEDQNSSSPKNGTEALGQTYADLTISQLIELLKNKNPFVQIRAAEALGEIGAEVAVPHLIKLLKTSPMGSVPWFVAKALGKINSASIIPQLMPLIEKESILDYENMNVYWKYITVSTNAAEALGELTSEAAVPQLIQLLENKQYIVRKFSAMALGKIGAESAIPHLIRLLEDENCEVRESAIKALGKIGADVAIPQLIKLLKNVEDEELWAANLPIQMLDAESKDWSAADQDVRRLYYHATEAVLAIQERCKFYNYTITVSPSPQEENNPESLTADLQQYEEILSVLSNMVTVMERNPKTFGGIEEEALRDHFLVQLNGSSKGQATGETFNGNGKTDILIRVEGKNIFIAECKFWGGEKKLKETLDQLLGYTTWRDTKLAMLIFNQNKNFTAVLQQIPEVIKKHPNFLRELNNQLEEGKGFRSILHHPDDKNRELLLTVLAFEIPRSH